MNTQGREALMRAMLGELARKGYREASIEGAAEVAGIETADATAEFAGKDDCLFAAYDRATEYIVEEATASCDSAEPWPERVREALTTLLSAVAAEPELARAITRSFPGIRPAAYARYVELLSSFVPYMREGREYSGIDEELPDEVELLAVGAAESIIFSEVDAGRAEDLPSMMPEILFSVLVPFLGPDRAASEMRSAAAIR